jgi:O-antigen/teichoic acid export membrane protein
MSDNKKFAYSAVSQLTAGVLGFLIIPIYINTMGPESYGLLGVLMALQSWFLILDSLLTPALSREMGRFKGAAYSGVEINSLFKSMEVIALIFAGMIIAFFYLSSGFIVNYWITEKTLLSREFISKCISVMGLIIGLKLLEEFYAASLIGLEEQIALSKRKILFNVVKHIGGVVVAILYHSIEYLLYWYILISAFTVIAIRIKAKKCLPELGFISKFDLELLRRIQKFSGAMIFLTLINTGITNLDKIILSSLISLVDYGHYIFAITFTSSLYFISGPLVSTYYPQFVRHVTAMKYHDLIAAYNKATIRLITLILPLVITIFFCGDKIIKIWTQDSNLANEVFPLVRVLILGTYFNTLTWLPYHIQLAYGNVKYAIKINILALIVSFFGLIFAIPTYGALGAAFVWLLSNMVLLLLNINIIRLRYMPKNTNMWVGYTVISSLSIFGLGLVSKFIIDQLNIDYNSLSYINDTISLLIFFIIVLLCITIIYYIFKLKINVERL